MSAVEPAIFFEAALIIEERGWYPGAPITRGDCVVTAICRAVHRRAPDPADPNRVKLEDLHLRVFARHVGIGEPPYAVMRWNDAQPDVHPVLDALRDCGWTHSRYPALDNAVPVP